jgi:hypothetical protein
MRTNFQKALTALLMLVFSFATLAQGQRETSSQSFDIIIKGGTV